MYQKLILFSSTTSGRFIIRVLIVKIYSPINPMKNSCTAPRNIMLIRIGAVPAGY